MRAFSCVFLHYTVDGEIMISICEGSQSVHFLLEYEGRLFTGTEHYVSSEWIQIYGHFYCHLKSLNQFWNRIRCQLYGVTLSVRMNVLHAVVCNTGYSDIRHYCCCGKIYRSERTRSHKYAPPPALTHGVKSQHFDKIHGTGTIHHCLIDYHHSAIHFHGGCDNHVRVAVHVSLSLSLSPSPFLVWQTAAISSAPLNLLHSEFCARNWRCLCFSQRFDFLLTSPVFSAQ